MTINNLDFVGIYSLDVACNFDDRLSSYFIIAANCQKYDLKVRSYEQVDILEFWLLNPDRLLLILPINNTREYIAANYKVVDSHDFLIIIPSKRKMKKKLSQFLLDNLHFLQGKLDVNIFTDIPETWTQVDTSPD